MNDDVSTVDDVQRTDGHRLRLSRRALGLATMFGGALGLTTQRGAAQGRGNAVPITETPSGTTIVPPAGPGGVKAVTLTASVVDQVLLSAEGKTVVAKAWGVNGSSPGPTLVFEEGDEVAITVVNHLPQPFAMHWHGVTVPNSQDGVPEIGQPTPLIPPGGQYTYRYRLVDPPGTHMYHSHVDIKSEMLGLTGGFVILPKNNAGRLRWDRDVIFWLHEWRMPQALMGMALKDRPYTGSPVDTVNSVVAEPDWTANDMNFFTMNGKAHPSHQPLELRLGQRLRVRFFNIGLTAHPMHFHGQNFLHVAEDGLELKDTQELNTIEVAPGKTQDILIEARNPGIWPLHCHIAHHQANNLSSGFGGMAFVIRIT